MRNVLVALALMVFLWSPVVLAFVFLLVLLDHPLGIEIPPAIGMILFALGLAVATLVTRLAYLKVVEEEQ